MRSQGSILTQLGRADASQLVNLSYSAQTGSGAVGGTESEGTSGSKRVRASHTSYSVQVVEQQHLEPHEESGLAVF